MNGQSKRRSNIYVYPSGKAYTGFTTLLHQPDNPSLSAIEVILNENNDVDNGRDIQRVVLTKKQEIRLELARLGTKIDKMGLRKSNKKEESNMLDKKSKSMEVMNLKKDTVNPLKKTISTYNIKDNTRKLYHSKIDDSKNKYSFEEGSNKRKFSFFNKLKSKSSNINIKNSLKSKKSNSKFETALSEVENAVERMMLSRLDDQRVTM